MKGIYLSVIVPIYNAENYLSRSIESIINQTYQNYELILVNDGSKDGSLHLCNLYKDFCNRITVIDKTNGGPSSARIAGIKIARGDYITFVDADDYVDPDFFEKLCAPVNLNRNIDIVIGTFVKEENGKTMQVFENTRTFDMDALGAIQQMLSEKYFKWSMDMKIYRRDLLIDNDDWPESYGEDIYINWKVFMKANLLRYVPVAGYHYCKNEGSLMRSGFNLSMMDYYDIWSLMANWAIENGYYDILQDIVRIIVKDGSELIYEAEKEYKENFGFIANSLCIIHRYIKVSGFDLENETLYGGLKRRLEFVDKSFEYVELRNIECAQKLKKFYERHKKIYIYGAGKVARELKKIFLKEGIPLGGYVVSKKDVCDEEVSEFDAILANCDDVGIVVGVNKSNSFEVKRKLQENGVDLLDLGKYVYYYE